MRKCIPQQPVNLLPCKRAAETRIWRPQRDAAVEEVGEEGSTARRRKHNSTVLHVFLPFRKIVVRRAGGDWLRVQQPLSRARFGGGYFTSLIQPTSSMLPRLPRLRAAVARRWSWACPMSKKQCGEPRLDDSAESMLLVSKAWLAMVHTAIAGWCYLVQSVCSKTGTESWSRRGAGEGALGDAMHPPRSLPMP